MTEAVLWRDELRPDYLVSMLGKQSIITLLAIENCKGILSRQVTAEEKWQSPKGTKKMTIKTGHDAASL